MLNLSNLNIVVESDQSIVDQFDSYPSYCTEPHDPGQCDEEFDTVIKYYFDIRYKKCLPFLYSGCDGNKNRFDSFRSCNEHCRTAESRAKCFELKKHCDSLSCCHGIVRLNDTSSGCEKCDCYDPCNDFSCPEGSRCLVEEIIEDEAVKFIPNCQYTIKAGSCTKFKGRRTDSCLSHCRDDADCYGNKKCCYYGCSKVCAAPGSAEKSTKVDIAKFHYEGVHKGSVTLKCPISNASESNIIWMRKNVQVKLYFFKFQIFDFFFEDFAKKWPIQNIV
jgi:Kunitz/Bovine pancreatic trypsin inhibitor domain/WAP-type (Whey Acidic Protein) 'four-disulfide core'